MTIVLALTLFANVAYFLALPFDDIARSTTIGLVPTPLRASSSRDANCLQTFSTHFLGRVGSIVYAVAICLSTLGTLNVKMFTAGRLTQAAAERGYLPLVMKTVARVGDKKGDDAENSAPGSSPQPILESPHSPLRLGDGSIPM
jgi:amino acid transporter